MATCLPLFCIHGLATSIHQNTQAHLKDIAIPCAHRIDSNTVLIQGLPVMHKISPEDHSCGGYCVKPSDSSDEWFCDSGGDFNESSDQDGGQGDNGRTHDSHVPRDPGQPRGAGRLTQPDRNCLPFLKGVQCAACKRVGHVTKQCNMFATAICLERYMKNDLSATLHDAIEKEWLECWKE
jgi:hypothetical protein